MDGITAALERGRNAATSIIWFWAEIDPPIWPQWSSRPHGRGLYRKGSGRSRLNALRLAKPV